MFSKLRKNTKLIVLLLGIAPSAFCQVSSMKIGTNPTVINPSAALEVESTNKGVLLSRVALTSATDVATIVNPTISMLIYNTATAGLVPNNVTPGYYYWDGAKWVRFVTLALNPPNNAYDLNGSLMSSFFSTNYGNQSLVGPFLCQKSGLYKSNGNFNTYQTQGDVWIQVFETDASGNLIGSYLGLFILNSNGNMVTNTTFPSETFYLEEGKYYTYTVNTYGGWFSLPQDSNYGFRNITF